MRTIAPHLLDLQKRLAIGVVALAIGFVAPLRAEDVLRQSNQGQGTYWLPIISAFYVQDQRPPQWPEDDGPPIFPEGDVNPPLHFTLNPAPADSAPTIDTDWVVFQNRLQQDEQASAWAVARQFGKPRLWIHRCYNEEYLAGYTQSHRLYLNLDIDVIRESLPISGEIAKPARKQLILDNIRIVAGTLRISQLNGVRKNGSGGAQSGEPLDTRDITGIAIGSLRQSARIEFIPRAPTSANGELLDGIIRVAVEMELEAGPALGLDPPERKKISGEIRFAVGEDYVNIDKLSGGGHKK